MTDASAEAPTCYRHPGRETHIRCQRCERPICPDCMIAASVGFQCPECVKKGRSSQRPLRTAYGGLRPGKPGSVSMVLVGINVAVWLLITATGGASSKVVTYLQLLPRGHCAGRFVSTGTNFVSYSHAFCTNNSLSWNPGVSSGAYWQLLTTMFTHVELLHIGSNMLVLWIFGPQLEQVLGRARFIALYFVSGLAGSAVVYALSAENVPTLGASGAIFGLMAALLIVVLRMHGNATFILVWIGINVWVSYTMRSSVSWQGHLGGFIGGVLVTLVLIWAPREHRRRVQWGGIGVLSLVIVASIVIRSMVLAG